MVKLLQLHKKVAKQQQQLEIKLRELSILTFACQPDAQTAVEKFASSLKYHCG
ncbi:MAG: hypothetical protein WBB28_06835 [Crinalium sp.]